MEFPSYLIGLNAFFVVVVGTAYVSKRIHEPRKHLMGLLCLFGLVVAMNLGALVSTYGLESAVPRALLIGLTPFLQGYLTHYLLTLTRKRDESEASRSMD
jgi:biotin transporter BioY